MKLVSLLLLSAIVLASEGDRDPEYVQCLSDCDQLMNCDVVSGTQANTQTTLYSRELFANSYPVGWLSENLLQWDCHLNCRYTCVRFNAFNRRVEGQPVVQYDGKWPFIRVFGITEVFSVIFLLGNLWANYSSIFRMKWEYNKSSRTPGQEEYGIAYKQYLILLYVSVVGWLFSTVFHIRDSPLTETCDYFGAVAIIMCNFNAIVVRYFRLYTKKFALLRGIFQLILFITYITHCSILLQNWDYAYNVKFSSFFGIISMVLWVLHLLKVNQVYQKAFQVYSNSIQLLPYETRILAKINTLGFFSESQYIPFIPIALNAFIIFGMSLELLDFPPIFDFIDAHALWHLATIFPSWIWYDWNAWDIEFEKQRDNLHRK